MQRERERVCVLPDGARTCQQVPEPGDTILEVDGNPVEMPSSHFSRNLRLFSELDRCRATMAHVRQSRPDSGLGVEVKVPIVPSSLTERFFTVTGCPPASRSQSQATGSWKWTGTLSSCPLQPAGPPPSSRSPLCWACCAVRPGPQKKNEIYCRTPSASTAPCTSRRMCCDALLVSNLHPLCLASNPCKSSYQYNGVTPRVQGWPVTKGGYQKSTHCATSGTTQWTTVSSF